ncbi:HTH-type transcriptional activator CmpR [Rhodoferax lithotrophicus]|uniref:HTH-type transcriptional activator CmpR n=1 Tax=Rhodoferax lithotrophicus TaxID=2798804 RepID=A0ABN6D8B1_9BURK|nr:LysR family transcriptional regulator [Rhodoferax sp. MIZ03]BCO27948.1 HTH-type transcriptional activator CmpR [Rhodoferax sp. MIZ03]
MAVLHLTLRQLQIFVAVARCGSTMAASGEVALSQSATSAAINELERLLSQPLFDRVGKRLLLNDNGRALLPQALAMLDSANSMEKTARDGAAQAPTLRMGASTTIGNYVLPRLLSQFLGDTLQSTCQAWQSNIVIGNTEAICDAVATFDLDIGLIEGPSHQPTLTMTPWLQDELIVVCAPQNTFTPSGAELGGLSLNALREAVWLLRELGSGTRETTDHFLLPHLRSYRRSLVLGSSEAIKQTAAEGLGLACLSRWVVNDALAAGRLQQVSTPLPPMTRQCYFVVHQDKQITPALRRFMGQAMQLQAAST